MNKLQVVYEGWGERWPLGQLVDTGAQILFEYGPEAITQQLELSPLRMPLPQPGARAQAFAGQRFSMGLPGLLADALPDGWGMLLMDRALRRAGRNPQTVSVLERLAIVGHNALGALTFEPALGEPLDALTPAKLSLAALAQQVQAVLADTQERTSAQQLRELMLLGGSPQGARPKVLLSVDVATGSLMPQTTVSQTLTQVAQLPPKSNTHQAWLIKFPAQSESPEVCAVEELYARLARLGGMDMPVSHFFDLGAKHSAFGVQRFDRVTVTTKSGGVQELRVPLISAAALLDADYRLPTLDYETLLLATMRLTGDLGETRKAFERCVFNVLLHNRDDHAKNFAFRLNENRHWKLSPAFDLTYSQGPGGQHSTSVAGEGAAPQRAHLLQVAKRGGLPVKDAERCIDHWRDVLTALPMVADELPIRRKTLLEIERCVGQLN